MPKFIGFDFVYDPTDVHPLQRTVLLSRYLTSVDTSIVTADLHIYEIALKVEICSMRDPLGHYLS